MHRRLFTHYVNIWCCISRRYIFFFFLKIRMFSYLKMHSFDGFVNNFYRCRNLLIHISQYEIFSFCRFSIVVCVWHMQLINLASHHNCPMSANIVIFVFSSWQFRLLLTTFNGQSKRMWPLWFTLHSILEWILVM